MEMAPRPESPDPDNSECDSLDALAMAHTPQHDDDGDADAYDGGGEVQSAGKQGGCGGGTVGRSSPIPVSKLSELRKMTIADDTDDDDDEVGLADVAVVGPATIGNPHPPLTLDETAELDISTEFSEDAIAVGSPSPHSSDGKTKKKGGRRFAGLRDSLRMKSRNGSSKLVGGDGKVENSDREEAAAAAALATANRQSKLEASRSSSRADGSRSASGGSSRSRKKSKKKGTSTVTRDAPTPNETDVVAAAAAASERGRSDRKSSKRSSKGRSSKKRSMSPFRKRYAKLGDAEEQAAANANAGRDGEADVGSDLDDADLDEASLVAAEDPLIDLFETHNTKRVVFDPTFVPPPNKGDGSGRGGGASSPLSSSFNIKSFMNRIIVKGGKERETEVRDVPIVRQEPSVVPRTTRPTSALRGGGRGSPSSATSSPDGSSGGGASSDGGGGGNRSPPAKKASFDPYVIDRAMSRSTNTAAVAEAAINRSKKDEFAFKSSPQTSHGQSSAVGDGSSFAEDHAVTTRAMKLVARANRAHHRTYRYEHAIGYYLAALSILTKAGYPEDHDLFSKTVRKLNDCHHAQSSLKNSANIVKMGIKHENRGEFVRALKMYTIAYRIRRDALGKFHPSLQVLLNMLGSVQVKRGELKEAMQIYELALNGRPDDLRGVSERRKAEMIHPTTKSVTLRDMGMIYERWGDDDRALELYQESLDYVMKGREREGGDAATAGGAESNGRADRTSSSSRLRASLGRGGRSRSRSRTTESGGLLDDVKTIKSYKDEKVKRAVSPRIRPTSPNSSFNSSGGGEEGEMEVYLDTSVDALPVRIGAGGGPDADRYYYYDAFFPETEEEKKEAKSKKKDKSGGKKRSSKANGSSGRGGTDVNVAMTLHQIAQINRRRGHYAVALSAYQVSLRGMKHALGDRHPNVAAILGNLGNLHKEMGNFDQAYAIYQEVLAIETHHLGLSHPEVSVTLHNIATIESSRGRYSDAVTLYTQVVKMQRSLFGPNHISVAVTSSCMGDVYERMGDTKNAMNMYEETLRIRTEIMGRQHVDVGRLLHKLGTLAQKRGDYRVADMYITRAALIYKFNKLGEDHPWARDISRDEADVKALVTMGSDQMEL